MKNIFKIFTIFALVFTLFACEDGNENSIYDGDATAFFLDKFAVAKGPTTGFKDYEVKVGTMSPVSGNTVISISRISGNAILGTDYQILDGGQVTIPAGANSGIIKVRIFGAGLSQTVAKTLVFDLISPTIPKATYNNTISLSLIQGCDSFLAGNYTFSSVNMFTPDGGGVFTPGPRTGTGTLGVFGTLGDGIYTVTDASFGGYLNYGPGTFATGVRLQELCGKLSFVTTNQFGDSFSISNVVVNGANLTFRWDTDYSEYGTTTLTRTDGKTWPTNLN